MHFGEPDNGFLVPSGLIVNGGVMVFERVVQVPSNKDIPNFRLNVTSLPFGPCSHCDPGRSVSSKISPTRSINPSGVTNLSIRSRIYLVCVKTKHKTRETGRHITQTNGES